ncbi:hypothetical protein CPB86DRAFT_766500 [Serendipita vermifera]|nr:hypothetical protein CPB86DRAFT_766500 [Serendipita vermifera]
MPSSVAAGSTEVLELKETSALASIDKRGERDPLGTHSSGLSNAHCYCGLCTVHRKSESSVGACDHERQPIPTAVSFHDMTMFKSEESYPDVPRTASSLSLSHSPSSSGDTVLDNPSNTPNTQSSEEDHLPSGLDSTFSHGSQRESATIAFTLANRDRSPSPRIFVQPASTQSNLSLTPSIDTTLLVPRLTPAQPLPGGGQNMSLPFVPLFRRVEERDVILCQICLEEEPLDESVIIQTCGHAFGRECMRTYILSRLDEKRFPIPCPCCSAADDAGANPGLVTSGIATQVNLSDADCARWDELEFLVHAVRFECGKCLKTLSVDRRKLVKEKSKKRIHCTTPSCTQVWCRNCQASLDPLEKQKHVCEGKKELKKLLKKEGWRQCPGCNIPVQKSSGCNHIACSAPGCNTHFCYRCGQILIRSVFGSEIHHAVSNHFRRRLYFWRCSQFHDPNIILRLLTRGWRR